MYLASMGFMSFIPMITLPIFTRILTKEDYGVLALALVYAVFLNGLTHLGLRVGFERNYFQYKGERLKTAQLLFSILVFVFSNFILLSVITFSFKEKLSTLVIQSPVHGDVLFWSYCSQFFYTAFHYYLIYFKNAEAAKHYSFYILLYSLLNLIFSIYFVAFLRIGVIGIVHGQLFSSLLMFVILSYRFFRVLPCSFNKDALLSALKVSYPLTPKIFSGVLGTQSDKYLVGLLASVGGAGIYSIGQRISTLIFTFMSSIENVFLPQVYKKMFDNNNVLKAGTHIGEYLTPFLYVSTAIGLVISLFSEEVISILTPQSFHGAIDITIILSMYYMSLFFGKQPQLIYAKKTVVTSLLTFVGVGLNIGLNIPFILKWGVPGAAWATLIAGLLSGLIFFIASQHYYKINWEYKKVGAILLIFFISSLIMIVLRYLMFDYSVKFLFKCLSLSTFIYLGIKMRIITLENAGLVKQLFRLPQPNREHCG